MKVPEGQEASLESSKVFYRGSRLALTVLGTHAPKSMKIMKIPKTKIYDDESPQRTKSQPGTEQRSL